MLTNKVSVGALRAPGAHNATFAIESHMDMMAKELGLDPLEVRLKNAVEEGDPLPSGQPYPQHRPQAVPRSDRRQRRLEAALAGPPDTKPRRRPRRRRLDGRPAARERHRCLNADGTINVTVGSADITGTNTAFQQIAAEVLDLPPRWSA